MPRMTITGGPGFPLEINFNAPPPFGPYFEVHPVSQGGSKVFQVSGLLREEAGEAKLLSVISEFIDTCNQSPGD